MQALQVLLVYRIVCGVVVVAVVEGFLHSCIKEFTEVLGSNVFVIGGSGGGNTECDLDRVVHFEIAE